MQDAALPPSDPAPAVATMPLRVLTLNIHKGFTSFNRRFVLPELREAIRAVDADVVCLQEVLGEHRRHQQRHGAWPDNTQYEFLADSLWPQHAYGRNAVYPDGHHGNAVLSKYPITYFRNHDLSIAGPEQRGLLHCTLALPGHPQLLHVLCTHLSLTEGHRRQQLQRITDLIAHDIAPQAPVVLAGDFNDWRQTAHRNLADALGLQEVFMAAHGRAARTFPAKRPLLPLDRIYTRGMRKTTPMNGLVQPWAHLSDHLPLAASLWL